jgi:hypothetical protein
MTWFDDFLTLIGLKGFWGQWGKLFVLSVLAATVQMYLSEKKFTFFHYFMGVLVAIFAAYSAAAFCEWQHFNDDLTTGVIAVIAYSAPHILNGLNNMLKHISSNPQKLLDILPWGKK